MCTEVERFEITEGTAEHSAEDVRTAISEIIKAVRQCSQIPDRHYQRRQFIEVMSKPYHRDAAPFLARVLYWVDVAVAVVYADGESIIERLACLLPKRERDALIGDAVEAVRLQHSLSVGKPWRKFAVLATTAFWAAIIVKNAALFAVSSQLPKRSR